MSQRTPLFLLGGINIYRSVTGTGVARAVAYTAVEMTLKTAPMFAIVAWATRSPNAQVLETRGASEYEASTAPVRRTSLTQ